MLLEKWPHFKDTQAAHWRNSHNEASCSQLCEWTIMEADPPIKLRQASRCLQPQPIFWGQPCERPWATTTQLSHFQILDHKNGEIIKVSFSSHQILGLKNRELIHYNMLLIMSKLNIIRYLIYLTNFSLSLSLTVSKLFLQTSLTIYYVPLLLATIAHISLIELFVHSTNFSRYHMRPVYLVDTVSLSPATVPNIW